MPPSPHTQAILLLTAHFSKPQKEGPNPLTPTEWGRFAQWLHDKNTKPEKLLGGRLEKHLEDWADKKIPVERIDALLDRGAALAFAMEKWLGAGLWVITRSDAAYPKGLKQRLGQNSPALLFGCGNKGLLNQGGLAVIGSRKATKQDLDYSREIGHMAVKNRRSIISGGARGVDEAAMLGALEAQGTVIGVLADSLLRTCSGKKYRSHLMAERLVLASPFYPEADFNIGHAMARNKYIYCLSDAALVVHSGTKGGTWSGAMENLKKQWVPLWIKQTKDKEAGNAAIVKEGARWIAGEPGEVDFAALFVAPPVGDNQAGTKPAQSSPQEEKAKKKRKSSRKVKEGKNHNGGKDMASPPEPSEFYQLFLARIEGLCMKTPQQPDELGTTLELQKTQLNIWLQQAVKDKKLKKLNKPVRYQWLAKQPDLFTRTKKSV